MKLYILSDIHGDYKTLEKLIDYYLTQDFDNIIILGDICHGHGNTSDISRSKIGNVLSKVVTRLVLVKGNCDLDEDIKYLPTGFRSDFSLLIKGKHIYFAHGHKYFLYNLLNENDIYCHGHTHIHMISIKNNSNNNSYIECNPGSISLPRQGSKKSYMEINDNQIIIYDIAHNILNTMKI